MSGLSLTLNSFPRLFPGPGIEFDRAAPDDFFVQGSAALRCVFGFSLALYLLIIVYPGPVIPLTQKISTYAYIAFALVVAWQARTGAHQQGASTWLLAGFTVFSLGNAVAGLLRTGDPMCFVFWTAWLPGIYVERAMVSYRNINVRYLLALSFLFVACAFGALVWMLHVRPDIRADMYLFVPVAHIGGISVLYLVSMAGKPVSERWKRAWLDLREAGEVAERKRVVERTATKAQHRRLDHSLRMSALDATVVHEISQPLAAIITDAGAASRWLDGPQVNLAEARKAISRVVEDGHRAGAVLNSFRSMISGGESERDLVHLDDLVRDALDVLAPAIRENSVIVQTPALERIPGVYGDSVQLHRLLVNLMSNAIDAMAEVHDRARLLVIRCERDDRMRAIISVEDSGPGLATRDHTKVFEPFFSTKAKGMGMGLFISRMVVEAHGGRLRVESRPGRTRFRATIPTEGAPARIPPRKAHV